MAERRALRVASGPGRVLDVDRLVRLQRRHPLADRVVGKPFALGDQRVPVVGADVDDPLEGGVLRRGLLDHLPVVARLERLRADQQLQPGLVHRVGELVRPVGRVDVDQDGADLGAGVLRDRPLRTVGRPHPDTVALRDAGADQSAGKGVHVPVELGVGPSAAGGVLDQRLVLAVRRHVLSKLAPMVSSIRAGVVSPACVGLHWSNLSTTTGAGTGSARPTAGVGRRERAERSGPSSRSRCWTATNQLHGSSTRARCPPYTPRPKHSKQPRASLEGAPDEPHTHPRHGRRDRRRHDPPARAPPSAGDNHGQELRRLRHRALRRQELAAFELAKPGQAARLRQDLRSHGRHHPRRDRLPGAGQGALRRRRRGRRLHALREGEGHQGEPADRRAVRQRSSASTSTRPPTASGWSATTGRTSATT